MLVLWGLALGIVQCSWEGVAHKHYEMVEGSCSDCDECEEVEVGNEEECREVCFKKADCMYSSWDAGICRLAADCWEWGGNGTTWAKTLVGYTRASTPCSEAGEYQGNGTLADCQSECTLRQTCSSFAWKLNATNTTAACILFQDCTPTQGTHGMRYDKVQSVAHDTHQADTTWADSHAYCAANNSRLCTLAEICSEVQGQPLEGTRWAPVGSIPNGWVQIGDASSCRRVEVFTASDWSADAFYDDVFCCSADDCRVAGSVEGSAGTLTTANHSSLCWEICGADPQCQWYTYDPESKACSLVYNHNSSAVFHLSTYTVSGAYTCELSHVCKEVTPAPDTLAPLNPIPPPTPTQMLTQAPSPGGSDVPMLPFLIAVPVVVVVLGLGVVAWKIRPTVAGKVSGKTRKSVSDIVQDEVMGTASMEMQPRGPGRVSITGPRIEVLGPDGDLEYPPMPTPDGGTLLHPPPTPVFSDEKTKCPASPMAGFVEGETKQAKKKRKKNKRKHSSKSAASKTLEDNTDTDQSLTDHDVV